MNYYDILLAKKLNGGGGGEITPQIKTALLGCFSKVAWVDEHGQDYYNALRSALYRTASLESITATYTQSGTVYDTDSLDSLKTDLVVTANWSDSSTSTVDSNYYTLSGTLTVGTSAITVTYLEKTTTFNVTVSAPTREMLFGTFSNGYAIGKGTNASNPEYNKAWRNSTSARATTQIPFVNETLSTDVTSAVKAKLGL